ncbi:MAG: hypothetical protein EOP43_00295 [Sphingobacteriaceae bacterium]|nr:MAG: hypothetical protein EOP43_00295 [Sphingobacteriaceae bacterium]
MQIKNSGVYLPIRAFGDFISTAAIVKAYALERIPAILPEYLKDFFNAVDGSKYFDIVDNISYKDQPAYYEFYKVKDFKNLQRLGKDVTILLSELDHKKKYLLDFHSKRLAFTFKKFVWPDPAKNIYEGKYNLFSKNFKFNNQNFEDGIHIKSKFLTVLIIPDSRIHTKSINPQLIAEIQTTFIDKKIDIARFNKIKTVQENEIYYSNFQELIELIDKYDLIISAESLPYHLANFYAKPHFVIYNDTKHFDENFMTPFMIKNNYYANFRSGSTADIIKKLTSILN